MPKLTLTKALATGVLKPTMPLIVLLDSIPRKEVWVSDERRTANDPRAVYLVVEVGDDVAAADALRDLGHPVVALRRGWYSYAVSPDFRPEKSFRLSAFEWGKATYGGRPHLRHRVAPLGLTLFGYPSGLPDEFIVHVEIDRGVEVHAPSYAPHLDVFIGRHIYQRGGTRRPLVADFHLKLDRATGACGLVGNQAMNPVVPSREVVDRACAMTLDAYRRAVRRPRGEGRG